MASDQLQPGQQPISSRDIHPVCREADEWNAKLAVFMRERYVDPDMAVFTHPGAERRRKLRFLQKICKFLHVTFNFCSGLRADLWLRYTYTMLRNGECVGRWEVGDPP